VQSNLDLRATYKRGETLGPIEHKGADTRVGAELIRVLKEYLSGPFIVDTETSDREIKIVIGLPSGVLEIITSMKKLRTVTTELVVMWSIGSSIVLLIIAALFMRNQVKPIRRLAHAADSFGKGRDVPDFKPSGAKEVRQASTAFIIMRERIKRQIQQRTEMLAGVSHDLRTPLTRMKLQLAMLDDDAAVEGLEADLAEMEQMVEEYLAFARGEGTEQAVETNLPTLLTDIIEGAQRNGHQVSLKTRGNLRATVRPNGIRRSLGNLITNAARFGDRIQVQAARKSGFVEITVDDNGPGVPEDKRDAVFTPFFRVDPSRNPESGGAGLGLTIARDIIRGHGGDIVLADSPLGGLRAVVRLPI
jgi:two-component system osmolarity sensor histidine kinase EnvZ